VLLGRASTSTDIISKHTTLTSTDDIFDDNKFRDEIIDLQNTACGFTSDEMKLYVSKYHDILNKPDIALELFESLVEDIHDSVSTSMWITLRDKFNFFQCLHTMRNVYLLGKGEFFQVLMDEIMVFMSSSKSQDTPTAIQSAAANTDSILNWNVLRGASMKLNLDEEVVVDLIKLRSISPNAIIHDFKSTDNPILLVGAVRSRSNESGRHFLRTGESRDSYPQNSPANDSQELFRPQHSKGAVWIGDEKHIAKGFTFQSVILCGWNSAYSNLTPSCPFFSKLNSNNLLLGSISFICHAGSGLNSNLSYGRSSSLGIDIPGSVCMGVSFHGISNHNVIMYAF
jgi:hypothetical protein